MSESVAGCTVAVVVAVKTPQSLHLLDNLHGVLLDEVLVGEDVVLLRAAVELCAGQDVGNGSKPEMVVRVKYKVRETFNAIFLPVEQHGHELDDHNGEKEKHENDTNWLQMKIFFCDQDLRINKL